MGRASVRLTARIGGPAIRTDGLSCEAQVDRLGVRSASVVDCGRPSPVPRLDIRRSGRNASGVGDVDPARPPEARGRR